MADTKKITKKELRKVVYEKLAGALTEFKEGIKEKKFENKLKKASKLFAVDIARARNKSDKAISKKKDLSLKAS